MKKYFSVSFKYSESVFCANIAHAETAESVKAHYSKYEWVSVSECSEYELETATRKGMPVVEIETEPEAATEPTAESVCNEIRTALEGRKDRSAWNKGVTLYAFELVDQLEETAEYNGKLPSPGEETRAAMLNGASSWSEYSWGGCSLIYNEEIAERLCCPSEYKKTRGGERRPNAREEWLDTQARALAQAARRVSALYRQIINKEVH